MDIRSFIFASSPLWKPRVKKMHKVHETSPLFWLYPPTSLARSISFSFLTSSASVGRALVICSSCCQCDDWLLRGIFFQKKSGRFPKTFQIDKKTPILSKIFPRYRKTIHSSPRVCCFRLASSVPIWTCLWVLSQHLLVEGLILCHGFREGIFKCNSCRIHRPYPYRQKTIRMPPVL